ncbi:MAG: hypothetical protein WCR98_08045, partial [Saccharofermentanales bacterium]
MGVGETWKDAFASLWNGLLYGRGSQRFLRILLALLLVLSIGWSIYLYRQMIALSQITPLETPPIKRGVEEEKKFAEMAKGFEEIVQARSTSGEFVYIASTLDRYPFNEPPMPAVLAELAKTAAREGEVSLAYEEVYLPPYMEVRAVMVLDGKPMALMYIEGEGDGLIVSPGYKFDNGKGKVVSITPTKVVVLWAGTKMELG